jgi:copper chaperone CopZ
MSGTDYVIIIILIVILAIAVKGAIPHFKGEGDCCGGPKEKPVKKKIQGKAEAEYLVKIEGMHCINCKNRIEKHLDELDGVIAKVNLEKKTAKVSVYKSISESLTKNIVRETIEKLDFRVVSIEKI